MAMSGYEIVHYSKIRHVKIFLTSIDYRGYHMHSAWELGVVMQGNALFQTKEGELIAHTGDIVLMNPHQVHAVRSIGGESAIFLFIQFSTNFCSEYIPQLSKIEMTDHIFTDILTPEEQRDIRRRMTETAIAYLVESENFNMKCVGSICDCFFTLLSKSRYRTIDSAEYSNQKKVTKRINRITSYIDENYYKQLRLADIAQAEGITVTYLSHFFHEHMNMTFQDYLNGVRLDQAVQLIGDPSLRAADICEACGISDSRFLDKLLTDRYGYTLKEYRKRMSWDNTVRKNEHYVPSVKEDCFFLSDEDAKRTILKYYSEKKYL